nr:hypothetical protein [Deinococcus aestuarii]
MLPQPLRHPRTTHQPQQRLIGPALHEAGPGQAQRRQGRIAQHLIGRVGGEVAQHPRRRVGVGRHRRAHGQVLNPTAVTQR